MDKMTIPSRFSYLRRLFSIRSLFGITILIVAGAGLGWWLNAAAQVAFLTSLVVLLVPMSRYHEYEWWLDHYLDKRIDRSSPVWLVLQATVLLLQKNPETATRYQSCVNVRHPHFSMLVETRFRAVSGVVISGKEFNNLDDAQQRYLTRAVVDVVNRATVGESIRDDADNMVLFETLMAHAAKPKETQ